MKVMAARKGLIPVILVAVLVVVVIGGIGLAWKTNRLDKWLPPNIKEMFGRGEKPGEEAEEGAEEEPAEEPEEKPEEKPEEDLTKDWKTWENEFYGISFKYPKTYQITNERSYNGGIEGSVLFLSDQTRPGNPWIGMHINTEGIFGRCLWDIEYEVAIKERKVEVLSRDFHDTVKEGCLEFGDIDTWVIHFYFIFEKSSGPACRADPDYKYCLWLQGFFSFLRDGPDYEPEFRQIIKTIRLTD